MTTFTGTELAVIASFEKEGPNKAVRCPCGYKSCDNWLVQPKAYLQGVDFTEEEARLVAGVLNLKLRHDQDIAQQKEFD